MIKSQLVAYDRVPQGEDALDPQPGDFILCHRKGLVSWLIRLGERLKFRSGSRWSHACFVETPDTVIEALTHGVKRTPLSDYHNIEYIIVRTDMGAMDALQAVRFAQSCLGQSYGWLDDIAIAIRFLIPGRGLWFGLNGTEICSGLVAQCLVRGWANFPVNPASMSPAELGEAYGAPDR